MVSVLVARKTARGKEKKRTKKSVAPGSQVNGASLGRFVASAIPTLKKWYGLRARFGSGA